MADFFDIFLLVMTIAAALLLLVVLTITAPVKLLMLLGVAALAALVSWGILMWRRRR